MKKILRGQKAFLTLLLLIASSSIIRAQSVTTSPLGTTGFCAGSETTVSYTASGTFGDKNVFTVQLSAPDGTFSPSFQNIGSIRSTTSGSIDVWMPTVPGTHYRLRVASSSPYTIGNDNGSDIIIGEVPILRGFGVSSWATLEGDPVTFIDTFYQHSNYSYFWDFGDGANPPTSTDSIVTVTYNTTGTKVIKHTITSPLGCSNTYTDSNLFLGVYNCNPSIPHDVYIDSTEGEDSLFNYFDHRGIWVVPGGSADASERTIYAEPGSIVYGGNNSIIYLKDGASYVGPPSGVVIIIYSPGAGLTNAEYATLLPCSSLNFDYTNAPPYGITWAGVGQKEQPTKITLYPNPATNLVTIESPEMPRSISIRNELGEEVLSDDGPIITKRLEFDVSRFASGIYYVNLILDNRTEVLKFTVSR